MVKQLMIALSQFRSLRKKKKVLKKKEAPPLHQIRRKMAVDQRRRMLMHRSTKLILQLMAMMVSKKRLSSKWKTSPASWLKKAKKKPIKIMIVIRSSQQPSMSSIHPRRKSINRMPTIRLNLQVAAAEIIFKTSR